MSQRDGPRWVRASDLAQVAVCERLVLYEQHFGKQRTREQEEAAERGEGAHDDFLRAALTVNPGAKTSIEAKPGCFVASVAFAPDAAETRTLRRFRDRCLRPTRPGRMFIAAYYRHAPALAGAMLRHPVLRTLVRALLRPIVFAAALLASRDR
jgi:hypothetical protein